ncbi:hypothetical protein [Mycolicibacter terrae]|nr:hypothetical protein [Mycolicibacter terrae]SNV76383.1 Uncharacterised protein [Mycolicibacter terrae]
MSFIVHGAFCAYPSRGLRYSKVRELLGVEPTSRGHLFVGWVPPGMKPSARWDYDANVA